MRRRKRQHLTLWDRHNESVALAVNSGLDDPVLQLLRTVGCGRHLNSSVADTLWAMRDGVIR